LTQAGAQSRNLSVRGGGEILVRVDHERRLGGGLGTQGLVYQIAQKVVTTLLGRRLARSLSERRWANRKGGCLALGIKRRRNRGSSGDLRGRRHRFDLHGIIDLALLGVLEVVEDWFPGRLGITVEPARRHARTKIGNLALGNGAGTERGIASKREHRARSRRDLMSLGRSCLALDWASCTPPSELLGSALSRFGTQTTGEPFKDLGVLGLKPHTLVLHEPP
jgi:hypothetical protein